ncbi:unnamed protein product [Didymodactylos carnosus]|uniref:Uncharacterized protein n=1 Tax=Didymodactylos carnosus TaxID=1234261 RepID=A0A816CFE4_9BILA|nr:unnamed protein product [Didymodactylos carnosus]CAF4512259.1 unnamed protein product [Didymodactylos carnosus]
MHSPCEEKFNNVLVIFLSKNEKNNNNDISDDEPKKADYWFLEAIGLALIPPNTAESTCSEILDLQTQAHPGAIEFNDYLV